MTISFLIFNIICYLVVMVSCYQSGWLRSQINTLKLVKRSIKENNPDILLAGIIKTKKPKLYEVFLTPKQIEKLRKEKS